MNNERIYKVIKGPHISEKSTTVADKHQQIVFKVEKTATKNEVKQAVEKLFNVKVEQVNMLNIPGKVKRFGQRLGKRKNWKKAYVSLVPGYDIEFAHAEGK